MSANWPSSLSSASNLYTTVNLLTTTLSVSMTSSTPSVITLASTTSFPTAGVVTIDNEVIFYTGVSGSTLTGLTRGADGTTAAAHNSGVPVGATIVAYHVNAANAEIIAIETDLHTRFGFGSSVVSMQAGLVGTVSLNFGDGGTGFYKSGTNLLSVSSNGGQTCEFGSYVVSKNAGFAAQNGSASAPTYVYDAETGLGGYRVGSHTAGFASNLVLAFQYTDLAFTSFVPVTITPTTNQLVLGATRTVTISAPTPATSSRTWTIPDLATSPTFAALEGTQTFSGAKTFSAVTAFSAGNAGAPGVSIGAATDGFYRIGAGEMGLSSAGNLFVDFGPSGSSDDTQYNVIKSYTGGNTSYMKTGMYTTTALSTTAKQIYGDGLGDGGILIVCGSNGAGSAFVDMVLTSYSQTTPTTVSQHTSAGSPASRAYSMTANGTVKLAMGSGTYSISTIGMGVSQR